MIATFRPARRGKASNVPVVLACTVLSLRIGVSPKATDHRHGSSARQGVSTVVVVSLSVYEVADNAHTPTIHHLWSRDDVP
jgi:hypothetical protein